MKWFDDKLGNFSLRNDKGFYVCGMHPKPSKKYLLFLGIDFFGDEKKFNIWYNKKNFWYGDTAPSEVTLREAIDRILKAIHGVYI
jgi:hypothetical protein